MRYWDASALVPLVAAEPETERVRSWLTEDEHVVPWAWTPHQDCERDRAACARGVALRDHSAVEATPSRIAFIGATSAFDAVTVSCHAVMVRGDIVRLREFRADPRFIEDYASQRGVTLIVRRAIGRHRTLLVRLSGSRDPPTWQAETREPSPRKIPLTRFRSAPPASSNVEGRSFLDAADHHDRFAE